MHGLLGDIVAQVPCRLPMAIHANMQMHAAPGEAGGKDMRMQLYNRHI